MELAKIFLDVNNNIQIFINKWIILVILFILFIWLLYIKYFSRVTGKSFELNEAEIGVGNQKIKIKPNYEDIQIAYKLWVELSTRKIGLPIDFEHDVISEIYNSWYEFFKLTRELIKNIPVTQIRKSKSTKNLVNIAIDVLNQGLRPHLTRWQAKFIRWYKIESDKPENRNLSPQNLQKKFPDFKQLIHDMKDVNEKLQRYRENLRNIALEC